MNDFTCKCYSSEYDAQGREYDWNKGKGRGPRDILHLKSFLVDDLWLYLMIVMKITLYLASQKRENRVEKMKEIISEL